MSRVTLGEVCREYKGRAEAAEGLPVVGLEHLSQSDIDLVGCSHEATTFTKAFRKGHVLFGRRRAYLKKASLAPFDGVCSGDIIVIEAVEGRLLPRLLPFVIQNDYLFDFAVENSAGSLSPRVKWKDLSRFEFELPSMEKQHELADLLWAAQEAKRAYSRLVSACDEIVKSRFVEMFGGGLYQTMPLSAVLVGISDGTHKTPSYLDAGIKFISAKNITSGRLDLSDVKYISDEEYAEIQRRCKTERFDILLSKSGSLGTPIVLDTDERLGLFESLAVLKFDRSRINPYFLCEQLKSDAVQRQFRSSRKGVAVKHLHLNVIKAVEIVVPPIELQQEFAAFVAQVDKSEYL